MTFLEIANEHWGDVPDWVEVLARECDLTSQNKAAKRLGYTAPVISSVLRKNYPGNMASVQDRVRGELMNEVIDCLGLGQINLRDCSEWRKRSAKFRNHNSLYVTMFRACNRCPMNEKETEQ